jgi:hypothetical protein
MIFRKWATWNDGFPRNMNEYQRSNLKRWIMLIICVRKRDVYHTCGSSESSLTCWPSHESRLHPILFWADETYTETHTHVTVAASRCPVLLQNTYTHDLHIRHVRSARVMLTRSSETGLKTPRCAKPVASVWPRIRSWWPMVKSACIVAEINIWRAHLWPESERPAPFSRFFFSFLKYSLHTGLLGKYIF